MTKIIIESEVDNAESIIKAFKEIKGVSSVTAEGDVNVAELGKMEKIKKLWRDVEFLRKIEREMYSAGEAATYEGWLREHPSFRDLEHKLKEKIKETLEEKEK